VLRRRDIPAAADHTAPAALGEVRPAGDGAAPVVLLTTVIRFAGGPWADRRGRYVHSGELTPMAAPGGLYRYAQRDPDGTAVYAFDST
jgi:hypothetical protein